MPRQLQSPLGDADDESGDDVGKRNEEEEQRRETVAHLGHDEW